MAIGDGASLLLRIRGDATDAVRALNTTQHEAAQLTTATSSLGSGLASLAGPAAIAATVVAGIGTAAIAVTSKLFDLSKAAAEYGSAIYDATQKTGLGAETMSALKVAAEQSGSSFEGVTNAVAKFNVLLGNAATGNDKAEKILAQYGITAKDTQGALEQAITAIAGMTDSSQQAAAAGALFKDRTGEILPVIKSFDGDLPGLIDKLRDLGILMSDEDAKAADEFGDQMDTLNAQLDAVYRTIGFQVMPTFLKFANALSTWLVENKATVKAWAVAIGDAFALAAKGLVRLYDDGRRAFAVLRAIAAITAHPLTGVGEGLSIVQGIEAEIAADQERRNRPQVSAGAAGRPRGSTTLDLSGGDRTGAEPAKVNTIQIDQARSTQKEINDAILDALKDRLEREFDLWDAQQKTILARMKADLEIRAVDEKTFQQKQQEYERDALNGRLANLELERNKRKELGLSTIEIDNQIKIAKEKLEAEIEDQRGENAKKKREDEKKELEHLEKKRTAWKEHIEQLLQVQELADKEQQRRAEEEQEQKQKAIEDTERRTVGSGSEISAIGQLHDLFASEGNDVALAGLQTLTDAFAGLGQAIGQVVQAWVLYGSAGTSVRKVTAQILASIAQQAAIKAIFELAEGFAALALAFFGVPNAGPSATAHFTAAAIYGGIAGIAAIAGRAVAGDSFKKQTGQAGQSSGYSSGQGRSGNQGEAYSSFGNDPLIRNAGANQPSVLRIVVDGDSFLAKALKFELENNTGVRDLIRGAAEA